MYKGRNPDAGVPCTVYMLKSTGEDAAKYVGQTSDGLPHRLQSHKLSARRGSTAPVAKWIRHQQELGYEIEIIEFINEQKAGWNVTEVDVIRMFREMGVELNNVRDGGGSREGYTQSYKFTKEHRAKISAALKGRKRSPESRAKASEAMRRKWREGWLERY